MSLFKRKASDYQAFEPDLHAFRMKWKMHKYLLTASLFLHIGIIAAYLFQTTTLYDLRLIKTQALIWASDLSPGARFNPIVKVLDPNTGALFKTYFASLKLDYNFQQVISAKILAYIEHHAALYPFALLSFLIWPLGVFHFRRKAAKQSEEKHIRGAAEQIKEDKFIKLTKKGDLPFGTVKLPIENEVTHTIIVGSSGKGKTVSMMALLERLIEREEQNIVHDFKGDYTQKFYDPEKDLIFNPIDERGLKWNLFSILPKDELAASLAATQLADVMIPPPASSSDPFWSTASRQVLRAIILVLHHTGKATNEDLWDAICLEEKELVMLLSSHPSGREGASKFNSKGGSNQSLGIMSTISASTSFLQYMASGDFDLDAWLQKGKGTIFLLNSPRYQSALRPILTLFLDVITRSILATQDSLTRRTFFLLDEMGQLAKTTSIKDMVTLGRSKGVGMFMGIQDLAQIDKIYGREDRTSIINSTSNTVIFGLNDPDTAKFFAEKIGKHEIMDLNNSLSMGVSDIRDGTTLSQHRKELYLIRPDEMVALDPLTAFVCFDKIGVTKIKFEPVEREDINAAFLFLEGKENQIFAKVPNQEEEEKPQPVKDPVSNLSEEQQLEVDHINNLIMARNGTP